MLTDKLEFEQVYAEFYRRIYRYLTHLIGSKEAEDLTQEVFLKIGKALNTFNHQSKLSTWVYQIATNTAVDRLRSRSFKQGESEVFGVDVDLKKEEILTGQRECSVEEEVVRQEMNECIRGYISYLPENYRTVIVLSEMEGMKSNEIAAILGITVGTVKIRLHRAKEKLKELLVANCNFYQTESCGRLACEPKGALPKNIKPFTTNRKR